MSYNLLLELLLGVVESLHALRTANCRLGFDVAESLLAVESRKAYARKVHKLGVAVLAPNCVSRSHSCNVLSVNVCVSYCKYNHLFDKIKSRVRN